MVDKKTHRLSEILRDGGHIANCYSKFAINSLTAMLAFIAVIVIKDAAKPKEIISGFLVA